MMGRMFVKMNFMAMAFMNMFWIPRCEDITETHEKRLNDPELEPHEEESND